MPLAERMAWLRGLPVALVVVAVGAALTGRPPWRSAGQVLGAVSVPYLVGISTLEETARV